MSDDHLKKTHAFVQQQFRQALDGFVGQKPDPDAVKRVIQQMLERFNTDVRPVPEVVIEVLGDTIKARLRQPSFINEILPMLKGPFTPWAQGGLVHLVGRLASYEVLVCTYKEIEPGGFGRPDLVLTCLECLARGD